MSALRVETAARRVVQVEDVADLARGCAILSTGGGGCVDEELERVEQQLQRFGPVELLSVDAVPKAGLVLPLSVVGAPRVGGADEVSGREAGHILERVEREFGEPVAALMCTEIGGANGLLPVGWAAELGLPLLDADGMGRAFPELPMISMNVAGIAPTPSVLSDAAGNVGCIDCVAPEAAEAWVRALVSVSGGSVVLGDYVMRCDQVRDAVIPDTISRAISLGRAFAAAAEPATSVETAMSAVRLGAGTVDTISLDDAHGFLTGGVTVKTVSEDILKIDVRNEYVAVSRDDQLIATVPDSINLFRLTDGAPVATESLATGMPVVVLAWRCQEFWQSEAALKIAGPRIFGYDLDRPPVLAAGS